MAALDAADPTPAEQLKRNILLQQGVAPDLADQILAKARSTATPDEPAPEMAVSHDWTGAPPMAVSHVQQATSDPSTWGQRYKDGSPKGLGYFGPLQTPTGGVMTELSAESTLGRYGDVEFPLVVPTLTRDELQTLVQSQDGQAIPQSIRDKAAAHATQRLGAGLSPYADPTEARTDVYPDLMRARLVGPQAASWDALIRQRAK